MPAQLMALTEGPNILLDKPILLFGRNPECDIQIDSRKVSRRHCCIAQVHDYLVVRDLGSTNGVRINGVRVTEGRLRSGDELTIGNHRYQVRWDPAEARPSRPAPIVAEPEPPRGTAALSSDDDDELLESCDEPVPLNEPEGTPKAGVSGPPPLMFNTQVAPEKGPGAPPTPNQQPLVPENLNLAPVSENPRHRIRPAPPS
jgi:predicted component of type VI protein secretion system